MRTVFVEQVFIGQLENKKQPLTPSVSSEVQNEIAATQTFSLVTWMYSWMYKDVLRIEMYYCTAAPVGSAVTWFTQLALLLADFFTWRKKRSSTRTGAKRAGGQLNLAQKPPHEYERGSYKASKNHGGQFDDGEYSSLQ